MKIKNPKSKIENRTRARFPGVFVEAPVRDRSQLKFRTCTCELCTEESRGKLFSGKQARRVAEQIVGELRDSCERIEIAGSLRRGKAAVHDVDLVIQPVIVERPSSDPDLFGKWKTEKVNIAAESLLAWEKAGRIHSQKRGEKYARFIATGPRVPVDVYFATEETWPVILFIRTGSAAHNIKLVRIAAGLGMKLDASGHLFYDKGEMLIEDEQDVFDALGLDFVPPELRE